MDPVTWNMLIRILLILAILFFLIWVHILLEIIKSHWIPNVQSRGELIQELAKNLYLDEKSVFVDLWCGDAEVLFQLQKVFPTSTFIWYESRVYPAWLARKKNSGNWVDIRKKNFFTADLSRATHVYCYLMPHLMKKVWKKITRDCSVWTMVYVNAFPVPDVEPISTINLWHDWWFSRCVYVYQV